jgi:hypothetical protein
MSDVKGMVQVAGATYRIVKVSKGKYDVIRILDEVRVGGFETVPKVRVQPVEVTEKLLLEITLTALKQAKISWQKMQAPLVPKSVPSIPKAAPSTVPRSSPPAKLPSSRPSQTRPASSRLRAVKPT